MPRWMGTLPHLPEGTLVRVARTPHYNGRPSAYFSIGDIATVVTSGEGRSLDEPHVTLEKDGKTSITWVQADCLEVVQSERDLDEEVALLFGIKPRAEVLAEAVTKTAPYLSDGAVEEIVAAVIASPAWRK